MRVLITGGTGFVGSRLAEKLRDRRAAVYVLSRDDEFSGNRGEGADYVKGDLLDGFTVRQVFDLVRPEVVCHLAAYTPVRFSFDNPVRYAHINYIGTLNLVEAAIKYGRVEQFVYASTAEIYGPYPSCKSVSEESVPEPSSPYSISKLAGEHYVTYLSGRRMKWTVLRPTNTYGRSFALPEEARGYFVEKLVIGLLTQKEVHFDGYGESTRRFMHVDDHVHAYLRVIGNYKAFDQIYNVAPEEGAITLKEVADVAKKLTGSDTKISWGSSPRPMDPNHLDIVPHKIMRALDWKTKVSLREGLARAVEYWKAKLAEAKA